MPTPLQLSTQNRHPDCLCVELVASTSPTNRQQLSLFLTLQFGRQWLPLLGGRIQFGIRGGELTLNSPDSRIQPILGASDRPQVVSFNGESSTLQVEAQPLATHLCWKFSAQPNPSILQGTLPEIELATLDLAGELHRLETTFTTQAANVVLTDVEGLWRHDITPNQHAVLDRAVVRTLVETQLTPYLSCARLISQGAISEQPTRQAISDAQNALQSLLTQLSEAKTNNFLELAQIAQLNPQKSFVGGNLLGANLCELDLSGANLSGANLRGAELNDADLSDANLQRTNLKGADLSGAYLGNADLRHANLSRASLALANLGGANLSGANLQETNLSNANLSNTEVAKAQLGGNPGLSEEIKQSLLQRGALFCEPN